MRVGRIIVLARSRVTVCPAARGPDASEEHDPLQVWKARRTRMARPNMQGPCDPIATWPHPSNATCKQRRRRCRPSAKRELAWESERL